MSEREPTPVVVSIVNMVPGKLYRIHGKPRGGNPGLYNSQGLQSDVGYLKQHDVFLVLAVYGDASALLSVVGRTDLVNIFPFRSDCFAEVTESPAP